MVYKHQAWWKTTCLPMLISAVSLTLLHRSWLASFIRLSVNDKVC